MRRKFWFLPLLHLVAFDAAIAFVARGSYGNHARLTKDGIKRVVYKYFREKAESSSPSTSERDIGDMSLSKIFKIYYGDCDVDEAAYKAAVKKIADANIQTDSRYYQRADYHADGEQIEGANEVIISSFKKAKKAMEKGDVDEARKFIGEALHVIQDFYSHSNWVEMGYTEPNPGLGNRDGFGVPLAGPDTPTCQPCSSGSRGCEDNLLVYDELTSGYFRSGRPQENAKGEKVKKPKDVAKCSHGGYSDRSARQDPKGGINKDSGGSSHGHLHKEAADVAELATAKFVEEFWREIEDELFEKFLSLKQKKCKPGSHK